MSRLARALVIVEWIDASSNNKWRRVEEVAAESEKPMQCSSVGWVLAVSDTQIVITSSLSGGHDDFREHASGDIAIPIGCITDLQVVWYR